MIENVLVIEKRTLSTVQYLNTAGCFINIGTTIFTAYLSEKLDGWTAAGVGGTYYGCLTVMLEPETALGQWALSGANLLACGVGMAATIHDLNEWSKEPTAAHQATFVADYLNGVLGCAIAGFGEALAPELGVNQK
jgi:hypothetical protein